MSIGANVEESQAAQSTADFIHKLEISLKEARETRYWLRLLIATELFPKPRLSPLLNEAEEIIKIIAAIIVKKKRNANSKLCVGWREFYQHYPGDLLGLSSFAVDGSIIPQTVG